MKTLKLTRRQVEHIRCLIYPAMRTSPDFAGEYCVLLKKLERLWKDSLYTGSGQKYDADTYLKLAERKHS